MNARKPLVTAAILAIAIPVLSVADETTAMNACVNAFVSANLPKEQKVRVQMVAPVRNPLLAQASTYEIVLTAKGAESGRQIAKATCVAEADGSVIALDGNSIAPRLVAAKATLTNR